MRVPTLTVVEPYASAIVFGPKDLENRSWRPPRELIGHDLAIHAGQNRSFLNQPGILAAVRCLWPEMPDEFPNLGCIIGLARLVSCRRLFPGSIDSGWAHGPYCWLLDNRRSIRPVPARGRPGIFYTDMEATHAESDSIRG